MKPLELELMGPYELTAHLAHVFCWKFHSSACCNDHKKGTKGDPSSKLWKAIHRETGKLQLQLKTVCFVLINNIKSYICQYEARHIKAGKSSFCWSFLLVLYLKEKTNTCRSWKAIVMWMSVPSPLRIAFKLLPCIVTKETDVFRRTPSSVITGSWKKNWLTVNETVNGLILKKICTCFFLAPLFT